MCPWTVGTNLVESNPLYQAHQYAYQPIAPYCHDYDRRSLVSTRSMVLARISMFLSSATARYPKESV
jgi:hypothetical protein